MATMPLVAREPWAAIDQRAKDENDLYKLFQQQAWQAEQNDLNRAQQNNMQQNQFGQQTAMQGRQFEHAAGLQQNQLDYARDRDELMFSGGQAPQKLVEKMKEKMQFYMSRGVPQHVAAALVGNAAQESGIDFSRTGDGGASYGEYQFNRNGEAPGYERWLAAQGRQNDAASQREYVLEQLQKGNFRGLYDRMVASKDPGVAAELFSREYERPNPKFANNEKRKRYATQAYTLYGIRPQDAQTAEAPAGTQPAPAPSGQQQSSPPAATNSGTGSMPDPNKPAVDGTVIEQRGNIIKYRKQDGSIAYKRVG